MLLNHGLGKLMGFTDKMDSFPDFFGIGHTASLALAVFGEVVCSALMTLGWYTRFAALGLSITMGVAFFMAHGAKLSGEGSGELAFIYLAAFVVILFTGAGKFSIDGKQSSR